MDPNATLAEIRRLLDTLAKDAEQERDEGTPTDGCIDRDNVLRLCELVEALDGWLSKGGFLPESWARHWKPWNS